jgi:hypothetical protein
MTATSQLVQAIENPSAVREPVEPKAALKKKSKLAKAAKHKSAKPVRLAARKISRG